MKHFAIYLRVSTIKQGASGLGLEAQRKMCTDFIAAHGGDKVEEFVDVESGTHRNRKGLLAAIEYCKRNDCALVIAKLDRLARDVEFCFRVVNTGIEIHFTDMPVMNSLLLGVFASVAQYERELTSDRTRKALAVKKEHGAKLGASNEKYREGYCLKSKELRDMESRKRGESKTRRFLECRDTIAIFRILRRVFPKATKNENPALWDWDGITTSGDKKFIVFQMMEDFRDMDETGMTFNKWDFSLITSNQRKAQQKLAVYFNTLRKSVTKE